MNNYVGNKEYWGKGDRQGDRDLVRRRGTRIFPFISGNVLRYNNRCRGFLQHLWRAGTSYWTTERLDCTNNQKGVIRLSKLAFKVNITPAEALEKVKSHHMREGNELIHEELYDLGDDRAIGTLVFQKYYLRAGNRAALVVLSDNLKGYTEVRSIATGSSQGAIFNFDWGAADNYVASVRKALDAHILEE